MSTNCTIVAKLGGLYCGTTCHCDGYEEGVGATLLAHYVDVGKIGTLIRLGELSSLRERVDPIGKHSFDRPETGTTVAYHRDRGEPLNPPLIWGSLEPFRRVMGNRYFYLFEDGKWTVNGEDLAERLAVIERQKTGKNESWRNDA